MQTNYLTPENSVSILRGTTKTLAVTVTNPDGEATNLTGARLVLTVKRDVWDDLPLVQKLTTDPAQGSIVKPREGQVEFYFTPADTQGLPPQDYLFDIWLLPATGERYAIIAPTPFKVLPGVTYLPL